MAQANRENKYTLGPDFDMYTEELLDGNGEQLTDAKIEELANEIFGGTIELPPSMRAIKGL